MLLFTAALLSVGAILFTLAIRARDLPEPEPVSPIKHLDERKATIYENLRDLQFEYRVGKLSETDYQATKKDLQRELVAVLAEIDGYKGGTRSVSAPEPKAQPQPAPSQTASNECPHCGASFPKPLKFCGECGKPMMVVTQ